jgi:tripartite-type tricarboxylate transporter receptor subunit TctC
MEAMGSDAYVATPDEFAARIRADAAKYADVVKQRSIKVQ